MVVEIYIQRLVIPHAVIHITLNYAVRRLRSVGLASRIVTGKTGLRIPLNPIWARAVCFLRAPGRARLCANERRRRIDIQRADDSEGVGPEIIRAEHPLRSKLALDPQRPLLAIGILERIRIADQRADGKELV